MHDVFIHQSEKIFKTVQKLIHSKINIIKFADDSYVLIDATNQDQVKTRRVTFANPRRDAEAESVYSNADSGHR